MICFYRWMDSGSSAGVTDPQQGPEMPFAVASIPQQTLKQNNVIGHSDGSTSQNRPKMNLIIPKADCVNVSNIHNKQDYDKIHNKNEENRRLLGNSGVSQRKIVVLPTLRQGAIVPTNGVKQCPAVTVAECKDSMNVSIPPSTDGDVAKTEASKLQDNTGAWTTRLRHPQLLQLQLSGLEESIRAGHTLPLTVSSLRSLKLDEANGHQPMITSPDPAWRSSLCFSDASHVSVRSLASVGMGSTDGRKVTIRRVPTSPIELFNIVNSPA